MCVSGSPQEDHPERDASSARPSSRLPDYVRALTQIVLSFHRACTTFCRGKGIRFSDAGPVLVKGFDEPIGHFEVELARLTSPAHSRSDCSRTHQQQECSRRPVHLCDLAKRSASKTLPLANVADPTGQRQQR